MPLKNVLSDLGDAIAGVDRDAAFQSGQLKRAQVDSTEAQADAAMALAMQRRAQAEQEEMAKEARQRFEAAAAAAGFDPSQANIGDLVLGGMGSDYSGAMQGRNYGQQYDQRELVGTPAGSELGDMIVTDDMRYAAEDALSPTAAIASRRPRTSGAPIVVADPEDPNNTILIPNQGGSAITVNTPSGPQPARPRARPPAAGSGPQDTNQKRNFEWLVNELGVERNEALRIATNTDVNPVQVYENARNRALAQYASEEDAHAAGMAAVAQIPTLQPPLLPPEDDAGADLPEGSKLVGHTRSGAEVYETPDGQRFVVE